MGEVEISDPTLHDVPGRLPCNPCLGTTLRFVDSRRRQRRGSQRRAKEDHGCTDDHPAGVMSAFHSVTGLNTMSENVESTGVRKKPASANSSPLSVASA